MALNFKISTAARNRAEAGNSTRTNAIPFHDRQTGEAITCDNAIHVTIHDGPGSAGRHCGCSAIRPSGTSLQHPGDERTDPIKSDRNTPVLA